MDPEIPTDDLGRPRRPTGRQKNHSLPLEAAIFRDSRSGQLESAVLDENGLTVIDKWGISEAMFFQEITRSGDVDRAKAYSDLTDQRAAALLRSDKFKRLWSQRVLTRAQARKLRDQEWLDALAYRVLMGKEKFSRQQMDMFKAVLNRMGMTSKGGKSPFEEAEEFYFVAKKGKKPLKASAEKLIAGSGSKTAGADSEESAAENR